MRRPLAAAAVLLAAALAGLLADSAAFAAPAPGSRPPEKEAEYRLKAAFLFNFAKFVEWPAAAFPEPRLNLCVLGEDPFGRLLDELVANEKIDGRPIAIERGTHLVELKNCHILFVSRSEKGRQKEIVEALHDDAVLTVGDSEGFLADGGMISFFLDANRVRFEIGRAAVDRAPLKVSSKLLRVARVVP